MAIASATSVGQATFGAFGAASVGAGLRTGLVAIQGSEEAAARIAEAREAAAEAARERVAQARDLAGLADEAVNRTDATEQPERAPFARLAESPAPERNGAPEGAERTGRGALVDVSV